MQCGRGECLFYRVTGTVHKEKQKEGIDIATTCQTVPYPKGLQASFEEESTPELKARF